MFGSLTPGRFSHTFEDEDCYAATQQRQLSMNDKTVACPAKPLWGLTLLEDALV